MESQQSHTKKRHIDSLKRRKGMESQQSHRRRATNTFGFELDPLEKMESQQSHGKKRHIDFLKIRKRRESQQSHRKRTTNTVSFELVLLYCIFSFLTYCYSIKSKELREVKRQRICFFHLDQILLTGKRDLFMLSFLSQP